MRTCYNCRNLAGRCFCAVRMHKIENGFAARNHAIRCGYYEKKTAEGNNVQNNVQKKEAR